MLAAVTRCTPVGDLIIEGGGFCGARTQPVDLDLSAYDGICLRVKSDGQTFKLNIKTVGAGGGEGGEGGGVGGGGQRGRESEVP